MTTFERFLDKECAAALEELAERPGPNWWRDVLASKDLILAVRGGYLNAYAKGQSVFKIGPEVDGDKPRVETHYKYLLEPDLDRYVRFDGESFAVDPADLIRVRYEPGTTLEQLIRVASSHSEAEKIGVHQITAKEPKVVDLEIAFSDSNGAGERPRALRMDLAVLVDHGSAGARLVFCEAKLASNAALSAKDEMVNPALIPVVSQISAYENFIQVNGNELALAYRSVCQVLTNLRQLGYHRKVDSLVGRVGEGAALTIHPSVYLLVFGFDDDQKDGRFGGRLDALKNGVLKDRVIAKGNASSFELSKDIVKLMK